MAHRRSRYDSRAKPDSAPPVNASVRHPSSQERLSLGSVGAKTCAEWARDSRAEQERHGRPQRSALEEGQAGRACQKRKRGRQAPPPWTECCRPRGRSPSGPPETERAPSAEREREREESLRGRDAEGPPSWQPPRRRVGPHRRERGRGLLRTHRPQIGREDPLDLSISLSGGKETNQTSPSSGERSGKSPAPNLRAPAGLRELWREEVRSGCRGGAEARPIEHKYREAACTSPGRGARERLGIRARLGSPVGVLPATPVPPTGRGRSESLETGRGRAGRPAEEGTTGRARPRAASPQRPPGRASRPAGGPRPPRPSQVAPGRRSPSGPVSAALRRPGSALSIRPTHERRSSPRPNKKDTGGLEGARRKEARQAGQAKREKSETKPSQRGPSAAGPVAHLQVDRRRGSGRPAPREREREESPRRRAAEGPPLPGSLQSAGPGPQCTGAQWAIFGKQDGRCRMNRTPGWGAALRPTLIRAQKRRWLIRAEGRWPWNSECVTTHLPNQLALNMDAERAAHTRPSGQRKSGTAARVVRPDE
ncbi:serine/arginine repetitive matrix protein 1-like [Acanthaster planci]|uniref:Serine/arginine repetitive matrix protein 1-like n=1 Tax=Acanthaster planci TaxID=133434 RepID=A0A8B8A6S4_ACAPL|nr:serine/arginine repetitive matrix protein 1-like [Acanthaster planci]